VTIRPAEFDTHGPHACSWRKSSFSVECECVEVTERGTMIAIRNSNDPDGEVLSVGRSDMASWIARIKAGEFDDLMT
jgi:hypothetical protein